MTAFWGVVRLEARLRRQDLLACGAALVAVLGALLLGIIDPHDAEADRFLRGGVLLLIVMLGVVRTIAAHRPWSDLRVALPLGDRPRVFGRLGVRALLALGAGVAFSLWTSPAAERPWLHMATTVLWLLLAGETTSLVLQFRDDGPGRLTLLPGVVSAFALTDSWHIVLGDTTSRSGPIQAFTSLGGPLIFVVAWAVVLTPEWLPTSAPKAVRPRSRLLGGLLRRKLRARSPAQVLRAMGGLPKGDLASFAWIHGYAVLGLVLLSARALGDDPGASWAPLILLVGGYSILTLKIATKRWSNLRAYPIRPHAVWGAPLGFLASVLLGGLLLAVLLGPVGSTPQITMPESAHLEGRERVGLLRFNSPTLWAPTWVTELEAVRDRPPGMPAPLSGGSWPLRGSGTRWVPRRQGTERQWSMRSEPGATRVQHERPRAYFHTAMVYYLHLVHGVGITEAELDQALGDPAVVDASPAHISKRHFVEYMKSGGRRLSTYPRPLRAGKIRVHIAPDSWRSETQEVAPISPPVVFYAFTPALERLQEILEPRLVRAARWIFAFDLALLVLLYLAFVRLALIAGPMRWALPLLPLLVAGTWSGSRAAPTHLAIRDAHLARPWVMVFVTAMLLIALGWSIARQLGRLSQTSTPS